MVARQLLPKSFCHCDPSLLTGEGPRLIVVDEIGKMELFSRSFVDCVKSLFHSHTGGFVVMATIPVAHQKSHWLIEELRKRKDCSLFEVQPVSCIHCTGVCSLVQ